MGKPDLNANNRNRVGSESSVLGCNPGQGLLLDSGQTWILASNRPHSSTTLGELSNFPGPHLLDSEMRRVANAYSYCYWVCDEEGGGV